MNHDDRIKKSPDQRRDTRAVEDAERGPAQDSLALTPERQRMFRNEFTQEALPKPPEMPGWHFCWVSTTNSQDPPHRRIRIGYTPVRADEVPGFEHLRMKSGMWEGFVSINEMLLFKIPEDQWQQIMTEFHHTAPNEEEARLRANLPGDEYKDSSGKPLVQPSEEDTGYRELRSERFKRAPRF